MKIVFFGTTQTQVEILTKTLGNSGLDLIFIEESYNTHNKNMATEAEILSIFVGSTILKEDIDNMPKLKHISTRSTGYDHIDIAYAKIKGITVSNIPSYGSHTVAEYTFALILDLSRKVSSAVKQIREDGNFDISHFQGFDLYGKTIGVVGTGRIGKNVIDIAKGFGMNIIAYDLFPDENFAKEHNIIYKTLVELVSESDITTIHAPYTKDTYHLINKDIISKFKAGSYLINTARGEIVDTGALIWGLKENIIAGAGLDVLEGERLIKEEAEFLLKNNSSIKNEQFKVLLEDHILMKMPNVIITPHIAFSSLEAENEILKVTGENILAIINGSPKNLVL